MDFPFDSIRENEQVYIVDYSIFPNEMEKLLEITEDVTWIDHHISAINRYNTPKFSHLHIKGLRYDGIAGCMLTYCYLKHMVKVEQENGNTACIPFDISMTEDAPMFTKYIADFDVWKFEYKSTKAFEMGLQLYDLDPNSRVWKSFYYESEIQNIIKDGYLLLDYRDKWSKEYCECTGFDVEFEGYKCFAVNLAMISSDNFKSINEEDYDMFIGFSYNGKSWNYSLRSTKVDCSKIAMKYGGGGHKGASGFSSDRLLF
jgi:oligoribonuclease NrnB/cAMP/cGMP phosphodiesterase (DHH superfamily)